MRTGLAIYLTVMGSILAGLTPAACVIFFWGRPALAERRKGRRYRRRYRRDMKHVHPDWRCARCGGCSTRLRADAATRRLVCADRHLCRAAMAAENMLGSS